MLIILPATRTTAAAATTTSVSRNMVAAEQQQARPPLLLWRYCCGNPNLPLTYLTSSSTNLTLKSQLSLQGGEQGAAKIWIIK